MKNSPKTDQIQYTKGKKFAFVSVLVILPFLILLIIENLLRIFNYGDNYNLFIDFPDKNIKGQKIINPDIGKKYFQKVQQTTPCHDMFLAKKPNDEFRIFVLGSSTVLGFPYNENLMFSRILEKRLQDSYPERKIKVINTALTAINSHTLLDFMDDILDESPDAILIYAGHNEFYGAHGIGSVEQMGWNRKIVFLHFDLLSFRSYQLMRNIIYKISYLFSKQKDGDINGSLMTIMAKNKEIEYGSDIYNLCIERYRENMDELLKKASKKKVPVFISEVVSNVKDLKPLCTVGNGICDSALINYSRGVMYEKEGNFKKAKRGYYKAKDYDLVRFRASEDINKIIRELAAKHNDYLVKMKDDFFEKASPNELIGNNLITEHVHPNIAGYFLMADAFFYYLSGSNILGEKLNMVYYKSSRYYKRNWGYTELDSVASVHILNSLFEHWPFKSFDAPFDSYLRTYQPVSLLDSLAFLSIKSDSMKINEAHKIMAIHYKGEGDFYNAFREYRAAIALNSYILKDYFDIAECLSKINDINLALEYLKKSLELKETSYAYTKIGEIELFKGNYYECISPLEKAYKLLDEPQENVKQEILIKLCEAYYFTNNNSRYSETLAEIRKTDKLFSPDFEKRVLLHLNFIPVQVENQVREAIELLKQGNEDVALDVFLKSLEIKETCIANYYVGTILYRKNDRNAIVYYMKAYADYKNSTDFLFDLCTLYSKFGAKKEAKEVIDRIKLISPESIYLPMLEKNL